MKSGGTGGAVFSNRSGVKKAARPVNGGIFLLTTGGLCSMGPLGSNLIGNENTIKFNMI